MKMMSDKKINALSCAIRKDILNISHKANVGHVGSAFSVVEILIALYFNVLRIKPLLPNWKDRDRFILSKGHAANALYPVLAKKGYFPKKYLQTYCRNGGLLGEHPETHYIKGIELATGSLGHGLSVGAGIALGAKKLKKTYRSFVLISDAECDEGETWEAALFAGHHKLDNLIAIIDYNKVQALGTTREVLDIEPLAAKWKSFRWHVREVDGHNIRELTQILRSAPLITGKPTLVIAHTVRGKGVTFMEHELAWHYLSPTIKHYEMAIKELQKNYA